jgi:uncharacterized protein YdhG (YjbR/CyaY superfamily)
METNQATPQNINEYIGTFPEDTQNKLQELRTTIRAVSPAIEEKISYGMPTFTLNGKYLVYFAAFKKHIGFFGAPRGNAEFKEDLSIYESGQGTLKFPLAKPLPLELISKIVKFRVNENLKK